MTYTVNLWSPNPPTCVICGGHAYATVGGLYYSCFKHIETIENALNGANVWVDPVTFDEGEG